MMKRATLTLALFCMLGCSKGNADPHAAERVEREAFAKRMLEETDAGRAWRISSTHEVQFEEGFSPILYDPGKASGAGAIRDHAFRWMGQSAHVRLKTNGERPMRLHIVGWVNEDVIKAKPVMNLYVDGFLVEAGKPIEQGHFRIDIVVPAWALRRPWVNLVIRTNAVGYHWSDPPELSVANVSRFEWTEVN